MALPRSPTAMAAVLLVLALCSGAQGACVGPFTSSATGALTPSPCTPGDCNSPCCPFKGFDFWCNPATKTCARCAPCPRGYFSVGCTNGKPRCLRCCAADTPVICRLCKGKTPANGLPGSVWTWNPVTKSCVERPLLG